MTCEQWHTLTVDSSLKQLNGNEWDEFSWGEMIYFEGIVLPTILDPADFCSIDKKTLKYF